jgi:hypothetical protein
LNFQRFFRFSEKNNKGWGAKTCLHALHICICRTCCQRQVISMIFSLASNFKSVLHMGSRSSASYWPKQTKNK